MRKGLVRRLSVVTAAAALALAFAATAGAARYVVVFKQGSSGQGVAAVQKAGGTVERINKVGVGTVLSDAGDFAERLRASGKVEAVVGAEAAWRVPGVAARSTLTAAQAREEAEFEPTASGCTKVYPDRPGGTSFGPDTFGACQWDMRIMNASPTGSYAVNQGEGATIGIMDTGVDLTHPDIQPNLNLALSCSFIRPTTPTSIPPEWAADCSEKSAVQDYNGHGTHVAGIAAAPINGIGVSGVAPRAQIVGLHAGTQEGYFFLQPVVDALVYAGDVQLDVVNMSFFVDPFLYNCHGRNQQQAIIKAVQRAASYAAQRGVVLITSAGNGDSDLDHPPDQDTISPDYPPGAAEPRDIENNCIVLPTELPDVAAVSAVGPSEYLAFYSDVGHSKVNFTAPGGDFTQAAVYPTGDVLNAWSSTGESGFLDLLRNLGRVEEDCTGVSGTPPCALYVWILGTSMASPHAAGVAALIRSDDPDLPPKAVIARMQNTAIPEACPAGEPRFPFMPRCLGASNAAANGSKTNWYGHGLVDALAASRAS